MRVSCMLRYLLRMATLLTSMLGVGSSSHEEYSLGGLRRSTHEIRIATFESSLAPMFSGLLASASQNIGPVTVLGHGLAATWGKGLQGKLDSYRDYVLGLPASASEDIVLLLDANDVLVLGNRSDLIAAFEHLEKATGKHVFFGGEDGGAGPLVSGQSSLAGREHVHTRWIYLNSGLIAGRANALLHMFEQSKTADLATCQECTGDQEWFQMYLLNFSHRISIDYGCHLFQNAKSIDNTLVFPGVQKQDLVLSKSGGVPRIFNSATGTWPVIIHFPGMGKWGMKAPCVEDRSRLCSTSVFLEVFRLALTDRYEGSGYARMQRELDAVHLPEFLRHQEGYITWGSLSELVTKIAHRDLVIALSKFGALLGLSFVSGCMCFVRSCGCARGTCPRAKINHADPDDAKFV